MAKLNYVYIPSPARLVNIWSIMIIHCFFHSSSVSKPKKTHIFFQMKTIRTFPFPMFDFIIRNLFVTMSPVFCQRCIAPVFVLMQRIGYIKFRLWLKKKNENKPTKKNRKHQKFAHCYGFLTYPFIVNIKNGSWFYVSYYYVSFAKIEIRWIVKFARFFPPTFQISLSSDCVILSWKEYLPNSEKNNDKKYRDMKWIGVTLVCGLILGTSCLSYFLKFSNGFIISLQYIITAHRQTIETNDKYEMIDFVFDCKMW